MFRNEKTRTNKAKSSRVARVLFARRGRVRSASVGLLSYTRRRSSPAPLLEHGGDFLLNRLFVQTFQRKLLLHSKICGREGWEKSSARASSAKKASGFATIERGEPWRSCRVEAAMRATAFEPRGFDACVSMSIGMSATYRNGPPCHPARRSPL